jgi:hydroxyisourate hydrolase
MTQITTHVLDTASGVPAVGVQVTLLAVGEGGATTELGRALTDADGRIVADAFPEVDGPSRCRLVFVTATPFFPEVCVTFAVEAERPHLHLPLLLSPYGYSVYRGS